MRTVILQPSFMPWLGYFYQIYKSDIFVFLDDVPYDKNGWRNRNKIRNTGNRPGWQWLTVPVRTKGHFNELIYKIEISDDKKWKDKHIKTLRTVYSGYPYFKKYINDIEDRYMRDWKFLEDINVEFIKYFCNCIGIKYDFRFSKDLNIIKEKNEKLIEICRYFNTDEYMASNASADYIDEELFKKNGIKLEYHNYIKPEYFNDENLPNLSILDLIFCHGESSLEIILSRKK